MQKSANQEVICFGEVLWDVFPGEKKPGGAPLNVAYHLQQVGIQANLISRVGNDSLGVKLIEFMESIGLDVSLIQRDKMNPTGVVNVQVGDSGDATYDIVFPSAWDFIQSTSKMKFTDPILIFGSLASRNSDSRETLLGLIEQAKITIFDVNFRAPHYTRELVENLLHKSDIVKINEDEISIIGQWLGISEPTHAAICAAMTSEYQVEHTIVTLGSDGALAYFENSIYRHDGFKVKVQDTVGSGDSFLASYLNSFLAGKTIDRCLEMACATGAYVATQQGAVPTYGSAEIEEIIHSNSAN